MQGLSPEHRALGKSAILVSPIAWGMWRFAGRSTASAQALIEAALAAGITFFDTADIYGVDGPGFGSAESLLGDVLRSAPHLRERMVLATKGGIVPGIPYDSSPDYLERALDGSLGRLGLDQIDLWQIHRPDLLAHPADVAAALERIVTSGKARAVGVSNFTPAQTAALQTHLPFPLASIQPELSALHTQPLWDGQLDQAMEFGMTVLAWSPLGGGRIGAGGDAVSALLDAKGASCSVSRASAAYAWIMAHPARPIPIVGSQTPERIAEAADAFTVEWTRAEWYAVLEASIGHKLP